MGASSLAAGHKTLIPALKQELVKLGGEHIILVAGGVIPVEDYPILKEKVPNLRGKVREFNLLFFCKYGRISIFMEFRKSKSFMKLTPVIDAIKIRKLQIRKKLLRFVG